MMHCLVLWLYERHGVDTCDTEYLPTTQTSLYSPSQYLPEQRSLSVFRAYGAHTLRHLTILPCLSGHNLHIFLEGDLSSEHTSKL
ncbi:hypothetical protein AB1N83_008151 [Pleurotus pulmonarius]